MANRTNGNGKKRWAWAGGAAAVLSTLTIIFGWGWSVSADKAVMRGHVVEHAKTLDDHEVRIRSMEERMTRVDTNVQWIRDKLDRE